MNRQETQELTDFIRQIRDEYDLSILMIEHHMDLVMQYLRPDLRAGLRPADRAGYAQSEVQNNPRVIEAYLGVADDAED